MLMMVMIIMTYSGSEVCFDFAVYTVHTKYDPLAELEIVH